VNYLFINSLEYLNKYKLYKLNPSIPEQQTVEDSSRLLATVAHQLTNEPVVDFVPIKRTSTRQRMPTNFYRDVDFSNKESLTKRERATDAMNKNPN
jgi:hypothetical protein